MAQLDWVGGLLSGLHFVENVVPHDWILTGHCLWCSYAFKGEFPRSHWFLSFWMTFIGGFGGGIWTGVLMNNEVEASQYLLNYNHCGIIFAISWWLIIHSPGDVASKLYRFLPVRMFCSMSLNVLRAGLMAVRIMQCNKLYPGVLAAPLILGTLAGSAGGLTVDPVLRAMYPERNVGKPAVWVAPGFGLWSGLLGSAFYAAGVLWFPLASPETGRAALTAFFIAHGWFCDFMDEMWDWTKPFVSLFHAVTFIPRPGMPRKKPKPPAGAVRAANKEA